MNWKIEWMNVKPVDGSLTNVVVTAGWRCLATDQGKDASNYGSCSFSTPGNPFIPYSELTENQVLEWCWENGVDKNAVEENVAQQLAEQINPPIIQPPLPW